MHKLTSFRCPDRVACSSLIRFILKMKRVIGIKVEGYINYNLSQSVLNNVNDTYCKIIKKNKGTYVKE